VFHLLQCFDTISHETGRVSGFVPLIQYTCILNRERPKELAHSIEGAFANSVTKKMASKWKW